MSRACRLLLPCAVLLAGGTSCSWYVTDKMVFDAGDRDGDGFAAVGAGGEDCDDNDPAVHPRADEVCSDGIDNDCDGGVDDFGQGDITWYLDEDADGFGTDLATRTACPDHLEGQGWAPRAGDCQDDDPKVSPGVEDADCDGLDENCDGVPDDDAPKTTFYRDADSDGHGDPEEPLAACARPQGYVEAAGDCADDDPEIRPGATDLCDDVDQDCDGAVDEDEPPAACYADLDGDLHGDGGDLVFACDCGAGRVRTADDCDDQDPFTHDDAGEQCDGRDNDCDGLTDEPMDLTYLDWFQDIDGDGYGDDATVRTECVAPGGPWVLQGGDCDDANPFEAPGLYEVCDDLDNDCSGVADDGLPQVDWYLDADADGFGDPATHESDCGSPSAAHVRNAEDCDDMRSDINPNQNEVCDGEDNDCADGPDDGLTFYDLWQDLDGDGLGDPSAYAPWCEAVVAGYVANDLDCDDASALVGQLTWHPDADGDCHGDIYGGLTVCVPPAGPGCGTWVLSDDADDCDDSTDLAHPGLPEVCNDFLDNSCDPSDDCSWAEEPSLAASGVTFYGLMDFGSQVTWVPDVNGDGQREVAVSDPSFSPYGATDGGGVFLYLSPHGSASAADGWYTGANTDDRAGTALVGSPDVTSDGRPDLIVGAPNASTNDGIVFVARADAVSVDLVAQNNIYEILGNPNSGLGRHVAIANDLPAVGQRAIVATARGALSAYLIHAPVTQSDFVWSAAAAELTVASIEFAEPVGDQNGDGVTDVGVVYYSSPTTTGTLDVVDGTATGIVDVPVAQFQRVTATVNKGLQAAASGDLDGDGTVDLLLGAPEADPGGDVDAGTAYLLLGPHPAAANVAIDSAAVIHGVTADRLGSSVAIADLTGDGAADVVVGATRADSGATGAVLVFDGTTVGGTLGAGDRDHELVGAAGEELVGTDLHLLDGDRDGYIDVLVGAPSSSPTRDGWAYVLFGLGL